MNKILLIGKSTHQTILSPSIYYSWATIKTLDVSNQDLSINSTDEYFYALCNKIATDDIDVIVVTAQIEEDDNNYLGIQLALYLRLYTFDNIPIIILSENDENRILRTTNSDKLLLTSILYSSAIHFIKLPVESDLIRTINRYKTRFTTNGLSSNFTDGIYIPNDIHTSRHSIANQWGAFSLAAAVGLNLNNYKKPNHLLFQYLIKHNQIDLSPSDSNLINALGKNILLIDDEADKGWFEVFEQTFENGNVQKINFDEEETEITIIEKFNLITNTLKQTQPNSDWDLILLDLRLTKSDRNGNNPEIFEGSKVLSAIKALNNGYQVMIITASNKAWNMKRLLELGADAYYIKEAPTNNFSQTTSISSYSEFKNDVENIFKRKYLRWFWEQTQWLKSQVSSLYNHSIYSSDFITEIHNSLDYSYETLKLGEDKFSFAFINYFRTIEDIAKELFVQNSTDNNLEVKKASGNKVIVNVNNNWKIIKDISTGVLIPVIPNSKSENIIKHEYLQLQATITSRQSITPKQSTQYKRQNYTLLNSSFLFSSIVLSIYPNYRILNSIMYGMPNPIDITERMHIIRFIRNSQAHANTGRVIVTIEHCEEIFRLISVMLTGQEEKN